MFKTLKDFDISGRRALMRCDFNVPLDESGNILDDFRIKKTLPTIKYLIDNEAKIILMAHLDPESTDVADRKYTMDKIAKRLSEELGIPVIKKNDCIGQEVKAAANNLEAGQVLLLENLRFYKEEKDNDLEFAKALSRLGDIYVNEAFSVCHRKHASITIIPKFLSACAGLLLEKEILTLNKILQNPEKPMIAIVGGKKVETKIKFINKISEVADCMIVSGLIKKGIIEKNIRLKQPKKIIGPDSELDALDINEKSIKFFIEKILTAKTILWNGPFGKFEDKKYIKGTLALANAIIESKAFSVIGGGETIEFLQKQGIINKFSHVSTGGGAMLAYLAGEKLPGIGALGK